MFVVSRQNWGNYKLPRQNQYDSCSHMCTKTWKANFPDYKAWHVLIVRSGKVTDVEDVSEESNWSTGECHRVWLGWHFWLFFSTWAWGLSNCFSDHLAINGAIVLGRPLCRSIFAGRSQLWEDVMRITEVTINR